MGKGEIALNEQFLLFPQCLLSIWKNFLLFSSTIKLSSANSFNLKESKICRLGKGYLNGLKDVQVYPMRLEQSEVLVYHMWLKGGTKLCMFPTCEERTE